MARPPRLHPSFGVQAGLEAHYAFGSAEHAARVPLHCHRFFEVVLVTDGSLRHDVNGRREELTQGSLVFIRPDDVHRLLPLEGVAGHFINLEFSRRAVRALFDYLGPAFDRRAILTPPAPPHARLGAFERDRLIARLGELNGLPRTRPAEVQLALRRLLFDICTRYLPLAPGAAEPGVPPWLLGLREEMVRPENLAVGLPRMVELSKRSHEYLCRAFRKHFRQTPTAFVAEARLNLTATLLCHTERKVADVAFEAGFDNLGHFHALFRERFGLTPAAFRARQRPASYQR
jgi:AraC family cel operon transcriptional repressor